MKPVLKPRVSSINAVIEVRLEITIPKCPLETLVWSLARMDGNDDETFLRVAYPTSLASTEIAVVDHVDTILHGRT